jgi:hypothetical protein
MGLRRFCELVPVTMTPLSWDVFLLRLGRRGADIQQRGGYDRAESPRHIYPIRNVP